MTHTADQSARRSAPASFGAPGRATGTSHYSLSADFFDSVRAVQAAPGDEAGPARSGVQLALHTPVSQLMALGTVVALVCAITVAVAVASLSA